MKSYPRKLKRNVTALLLFVILISSFNLDALAASLPDSNSDTDSVISVQDSVYQPDVSVEDSVYGDDNPLLPKKSYLIKLKKEQKPKYFY
ncbi:hypothetical protein OMP38_27495 [Cohnella ginsengisoli]|uniref:Uncharacterized protein n=1 Tax=Cohnella ginsengisoli TaxID=425004 RepID=A0A9X4KQ53_9BACL|nr:hypothetical protein [Cohnella ginsengisoli]MDG0794162.1 hypothetical protein [Cohnella ginsengisoli]